MSDHDPNRPDLTPPPPLEALHGAGRVPPLEPVGISDPFAPPEQERTNVAGLIAFIASLLGFCIPVLPTIVALVLGIVGVFKPRRGFAIAAIVISVVQFIGLALLTVALVAAARSGKFQTLASVVSADIELKDSLDRERRGETVFKVGAPSDFRADDGWGTPFRVEIVEANGERQVFILSAGRDLEFGTADDFVAACHPKNAAEKAGRPLPDLD